MSNQAEVTIRMEMVGAQPGESRRRVCPFCDATHEQSFDMRRSADKPHLIFFTCYRGSCAQHGYVVDRQGTGMVLTQENMCHTSLKLTSHPRPPPEFLQNIAIKYHISTDYLQAQGVRYDQGEALCMPWRDENGKQVGWVEKRFNSAWPKSHHDLSDKSAGRLGFPNVPWSYHAHVPQLVCVVVESLIDAYRINDYAQITDAGVTAVALLGADLSSRDALRLATLFDYVMVCLDPDQWPKGSMRVVRRFAGMPVVVAATTLQTDPKDADDASLEALFERCREMMRA